jgi:hypothetical protein
MVASTSRICGPTHPTAAAFFLLLCLCSAPSRASEHYLCFEDTGVPHALMVNIATDAAASGTVAIDGLAFSQPFSIPVRGMTSIRVPASAMVSGSGIAAGRAVHVSCDVDVQVYAFEDTTGSSEGERADPVTLMGSECYVMTYTASVGFPSQFAVVATADGSTVEVVPSSANDAGRPAGVAYSIALDRGDVYQLQASLAGQDLSRTHIRETTGKPVAVFAGNSLGFVPVGTGYADHIAEQMPPLADLGTEYVAVPTMLHSADRVRMLAPDHGTVFTASDGGGGSLTGVFERSVTAPVRFVASGAMLVEQFVAGATVDPQPVTNADPSAAVLLPRSAWGNLHRIVVPPDTTQVHHLAIVAPCASSDSVLLDSNHLAAESFTSVSGTTDCAARVQVTPGVHVLAAPVPIQVLAYGATDYTSYAFASRGILSAYPPPPPADVTPTVEGRGAMLSPSRPNPFTNLTSIRCVLPTTMQARLAIYDPAGRLVRGIFDGWAGPGVRECTWDGRDASGRMQGAGVYLCQLRAGRDTFFRRIVLLR